MLLVRVALGVTVTLGETDCVSVALLLRLGNGEAEAEAVVLGVWVPLPPGVEVGRRGDAVGARLAVMLLLPQAEALLLRETLGDNVTMVEGEVVLLGVRGAVALAREGEGEECALGEATLLGVPKPALLLGEGEMEVKGLAEIRAVALAKEGEGIALGEAEPVPLLEGELLLLPAGERVAEVLTLELAVAQ